MPVCDVLCVMQVCMCASSGGRTQHMLIVPDIHVLSL
jgi:hypothetical protein